MSVNVEQKKRVQTLLVQKGFNLGNSGPRNDGVDGLDGQKTWDAMEQYLLLPSHSQPVVSSKALINPQAFASWAPKALPGTYAALEATAQKWNLKDLVLIHWLGQMFVESQGFSTLTENLNYSVEGLRKTFSRSRISDAECQRLGRTSMRAADQKGIANTVYGGTWGRDNLGNRLTHPNDGWDNRGAGFKQLTGYENISQSGYTAEELRTDVIKAADAAAWYFVSKKPQCVTAALRDDIEDVTKAVNGGLNGFAERRVATAQARNMINV